MIELFVSNVTVEVVHVDALGQSTVAGYLFVTNGAVKGAQEQRWVLWPGFAPLPEKGTIHFRSPPAELSFTTLEGWQNAVMAEGRSGLWRKGSTYAKVSSRSFTEVVDPHANAPEYPTLTMDAHFKTQAYNRRKKGAVLQGGAQIESRVWQMQSKTSDQWVRIGKVCGSKLTQDASDPALRYNREYWVTLPGYQPPLSLRTEPLLVLEPEGAATTLNEFFAGVWTDGATFTITSCSYLDGIPSAP